MAKEPQPVPDGPKPNPPPPPPPPPPPRRVDSIRCYVAVVGQESSGRRFMALGTTAQEACDAMDEYYPLADINVARCQQVTITPGWGDETEPRLAFAKHRGEAEGQGW